MGHRNNDDYTMTETEFTIALADATAKGLIKWRNDEELALTDKGFTYGIELQQAMADTDFLILWLLYGTMSKMTEEGE